jgi:hypothetical protein
LLKLAGVEHESFSKQAIRALAKFLKKCKGSQFFVGTVKPFLKRTW